jgi:hypothetical protein
MSGENDDAALLSEALASDVASTPAETVAPEPMVEADPEPVQEVSHEPEALAPEPVPEQAPAPVPVESQQTREPEHRVPLAEHLAEREKRQAIQRERDMAIARAEQIARELEALRAPKQPAPDFFDDPNVATKHLVREELNPYEQRMRMMEAQTEMLGKEFAIMQHGADKVNAAQGAIAELVQSGDPRARMDYQAIMAAPPAARYRELMDWHARREVFTKTGGDLGKYEQSLQEKLLADPAFLARALEAAQKNAATRPAAVVVPSNAAPARRPTSLPSVSQMGAAAPINKSGDLDVMDDRALLAAVTGRK